MNLITLAEAKAYLKIPSSDTDNDVFLETQIRVISDAIAAYTRRNLKAADYVETFYRERACTFGRRGLKLHHYPVISIDEFDWVGPGPSGVDVTSPIVNYRLHKPSGKIIDLDYGVYLGYEDRNYLEVSYRAGYEVLPGPVLDCVLSLLQSRYNKSKLGIDLNFGSDVQSINIPGTIGINFDYTLQGNDRASTLGVILGNYLNVLDFYRSDRAVMPSDQMTFIEEV